jgi:uncharacterized protein YeaO (DUF488 family)
MIRLARVYDAPLPPGPRFLVDRVWPRGIRREELGAVWLRDAAPSEDLRRWFGHDPTRWAEFQVRYAAELATRPQAWAPLAAAARRGEAVLLYAAKDSAHNNAVALAAYVERELAAEDAAVGAGTVTCGGCGRVETRPGETAPATWTATRAGGGATSWLCERCTRENLRALEARLDPAWW